MGQGGAGLRSWIKDNPSKERDTRMPPASTASVHAFSMETLEIIFAFEDQVIFATGSRPLGNPFDIDGLTYLDGFASHRPANAFEMTEALRLALYLVEVSDVLEDWDRAELSPLLHDALQRVEAQGVRLDVLKALRSAQDIAHARRDLMLTAVLGNILCFAARPVLVHARA